MIVFKYEIIKIIVKKFLYKHVLSIWSDRSCIILFRFIDEAYQTQILG